MSYWKPELAESYQDLLEFYSSWCARNSVMMTPTHRFSPCQTWLKKFSLKKSDYFLVGIVKNSCILLVFTLLETTENIDFYDGKLKKKVNCWTLSKRAKHCLYSRVP